MPLEQSPHALDGVRDVEEPADQVLDPRERPPLISPAMRERPAFQLPLQAGELARVEPLTTRRTLGQDPRFTVLPVELDYLNSR